MSNEVEEQATGNDVVQLEDNEVEEIKDQVALLDTPEKRFTQLSRNFVSAIAIISEMQSHEDWKELKKEDGSDYRSLTEVVQNALQVSDSYARRLVQTADNFYTPLEAVTVQGTVINIRANEAAQLGTAGMEEVVDGVNERIDESDDPEAQSALIDEVTDDVLGKKNGENEVSEDDFADDDFYDVELSSLSDDLADDDFGDDLDGESLSDDFEDDDAGSGGSSGEKPSGGADGGSDGGSTEKPAPNVKEDKQKDTKSEPQPKDYTGPIDEIMSGGKEYVDEESISELPEKLQDFVRAVNYLASIDSQEISDLITQERRGVTYNISKASSQLTMVKSSTEVASWVLEQL